MNEQHFQRQLQNEGMSLSEKQRHQFSVYYDTLIEWNKKMNLTAITGREKVYEKHFYDSLTAAFVCDLTNVTNLCDVGAGAGFPSIPLKICYPALDVTIVDSLKKRIHFLDHLLSELNLTGVNLYHDRAETFARSKNFRATFEVVIARAVARLPVLSELCLPLVKVGGVFLAMKGPQIDEEKTMAERALAKLGGEQSEQHKIVLPVEKSERNILVYQKIKPTPKKYPRKPGTPSKDPL